MNSTDLDLGQFLNFESKRIAHYKLIRNLGAGGMGIVFAAEDTLLNRQVALKVLKPNMADMGDAKQRFLREARAAAQITHDHVVTIFQVGEENGVPFLAMQLLEGETLESYYDRIPQLEIKEIVRISKEIAEGLSAAHRKGLIHRDIKPANIWLEGPRKRVKILDFGLARMVENTQQLTQTGVVMGTPSYMSPEQVCGETLDSRSDLFSLGCVMYQLLTRIRPFDGPNIMAIFRNLELKDAQDLRSYRSNTPFQLVQLVHQLLEKNPANRPASGDEVVDRLEEIPLEKDESGYNQVLPPSVPDSSGVSLETPRIPSPKMKTEETRLPNPPTYQRPAPIVLPSSAYGMDNEALSSPSLDNKVPDLGIHSVSNQSFYPQRQLISAAHVVEPTPSVPPSPRPAEWQNQPRSHRMLFLILGVLFCGFAYFMFTRFFSTGELIIDDKLDPQATIVIQSASGKKTESVTVRRLDLEPGEYELKLESHMLMNLKLDQKHIKIQMGKTTKVAIVEGN